MKKLTGLVLLIAIPLMVYLGFFEGVEGAQYVVKFFVWAICLPTGILALTAQVQVIMAKGPASSLVFRFFSRLVSWSVLATFIWFGHIVTGIAWGFYMLCAVVNKHGVETLRSKSTETPNATVSGLPRKGD